VRDFSRKHLLPSQHSTQVKTSSRPQTRRGLLRQELAKVTVKSPVVLAPLKMLRKLLHGLTNETPLTLIWIFIPSRLRILRVPARFS
jgi:hypothetical protein